MLLLRIPSLISAEEITVPMGGTIGNTGGAAGGNTGGIIGGTTGGTILTGGTIGGTVNLHRSLAFNTARYALTKP
ncbi:MAG TPA: hypothetical protein ENH60_07840 [Pricia sp.]|nr:hypothetical protein [Pricia sp.]